LLGQEIHLVSGGQDFRGRAAGIDDHGALQLEDTDGRSATFSAGDVHLTALENPVAFPEELQVTDQGEAKK
jgi:biotin-(acetyl-CoA carboxylase) ligase